MWAKLSSYCPIETVMSMWQLIFLLAKWYFLTDAWQDVACHRKQNAKLKKHVWVQKKVHFISSCSKVLHPKKVNSNEAGTEIPIVAFDISFDINFSWSMSGTALCFAAQNLFKEGKCGWKKLTIAEETLCSVYSLRKFWHGMVFCAIKNHEPLFFHPYFDLICSHLILYSCIFSQLMVPKSGINLNEYRRTHSFDLAFFSGTIEYM